MNKPSSTLRPEWNDADYSLLLGAIERLEAAWKELPGPNLAEFVPMPAGDARRVGMLVRLIGVDHQCRCRRGMKKELADYLAQWPELQGNAELAAMFVEETIDQPGFRPPSEQSAAKVLPARDPPAAPLQPWAIHILCPACQQRIEIVDDSPEPEMNCPSCGSGFSLADRGVPLDHSQAGPARIRRRIAHFELTDQLGMGAFGSVWKARDTDLDKVVALKVPRASQLDGDASERFIREARAAGRLLHPNIVNVQAVGRDGDLLYIVSEFIDGASLDKWKLGRTLDFSETARLCVKIAEALHFAHENQVTHRDLKPQNILMDEAGEPHLTDFGLAKRDAELTMTIEGQILGTPAYLPPEQASGRSHEADGRSDLYSLGVMLFELLTGVLPFQGTRYAVIRQHLELEPPVPRSLNPLVPRDLETICLKCLEKDPRRRYQTAKELADELRKYLDGKPIVARPISRPERLWRWCKRQPVVAGLTAAVVMSLLVGSGVSIGLAVSAYQSEQRANEGWAQADDNAARANDNATEAAINADRADAKRKEAERELLRARQAEYTFQIASAQEALANRDFAAAEDLLTRCARDLGGWEHDYLCTRLRERLKVALRTKAVSSVAFSPDGQRVVSGNFDGTLTIWDVATHQTIGTLKGHTREVPAVAFSPDGKRIVSGSADKSVKIWDAASCKETLSFTEHRYDVCSVAFSPDGTRVASQNKHFDRELGTVKIWDAATGKESLSLRVRAGWVRGVAFSPDGKRLVSGGTTGELAIWDAASGKETLTLGAPARSVSCVALSPDGKLIASGSGSGTLTLWDAVSGKEALTLKGHTRSVSCLAFSPNGKNILADGGSGTLTLWDTRTGQETLTFRGHFSGPAGASFSPDGSQIVSGSDEGTLKIWDVTTGPKPPTTELHDTTIKSQETVEYLLSPDATWIATGLTDGTLKVWDAVTGHSPFTLKGATDNVSCLAFSPDGKRLSAGFLDGTVKVWDVATGRTTFAFKSDTHLTCVALSLDGKRIAAGLGDGTLKVWDADAGRNIFTFKSDDLFRSVALSVDGKRIVASDDNGRLKAWDTETGLAAFDCVTKGYDSINLAFSADGRRLLSHYPVLGAADVWDAGTGQHILTLSIDKGVSSVAFSADGKRIAAGSLSGRLKIWDSATGQDQPGTGTHAGEVRAVAFSPDGRRIVSSSVDGTVKIWNSASGRETLTLNTHDRDGGFVAFSADGRRIVSISQDNTPHIWDAARGQDVVGEAVGYLGPNNHAISTVAFSTDGERIVAGSNAGTLQIWDSTRGGNARTVEGHTARVSSVVFSRDGNRFVSGSDDGTVKIWDAIKGRETRTLWGHGRDVNSVAFSPDGALIVSADETRVKIWDAATGHQALGHTCPDCACVALSPDGKRIASIDRQGTLKVWDAGTGKDICALDMTADVSRMTFSPNGSQIVFVTGPGRVGLWDVVTGKETITFKFDTAGEPPSAISPDCKRLVIARMPSSDIIDTKGNTVTIEDTFTTPSLLEIWDIGTGKQSRTIKGAPHYVSTVTFSANGERIAAGHWDGTVHVFDASTGQELLSFGTKYNDGGPMGVGFF